MLKGFRHLSCMCFFFRFERSVTSFFFFDVMKFCDVIAGAFGVSGCIPLRTVLRDVPIVVQFWCVSEHIRLLSMISLFRFVVFFSAVLETCVRGDQAKFVAGGTKSTD